ncbi:MAG: hypothetical protein HKN58_00610 [Xanthomonadales bacterium]|nr:hypothetical protein [Xanthomonadales bacterium]
MLAAPRSLFLLPACLLTLVFAAACEPGEQASATILVTGSLRNPALDEASGLRASQREDGVYFLHNDDGEPRLYAIDKQGQSLGDFTISGASNRDWEDLTAVPSPSGPLLVAADTGDNFAQHEQVWLYFVAEPERAGRFEGDIPMAHAIALRYPDGPRDCESVGWDPASDRIYFLSKRDTPSRIYSIAREAALASESAELEFDGTVHPFRPPTSRDIRLFGRRDGPWVSQPTGLDFSPDGRQAAVISYRSLYLFERQDGESWPQAFQRKPIEFEGPPSRKEEALAYSRDGGHIMITSEGASAPVYRFNLDDGVQSAD